MKLRNTIFIFIQMFTVVVFAADVPPQSDPKKTNYFWDQDGNLHLPPCSLFFEGVGEQKKVVCNVQDYFTAMKICRNGEIRKICRNKTSKGFPRNSFLFYGPSSDEDKEEVARQLAERDGAIIEFYDLDEIMSKEGSGWVVRRAYHDADELSQKNGKLIILYFKSNHQNREHVWLIKSYVDKYERNPNIATIVPTKRIHDLDDPPLARFDWIEIKAPYWRDREKNIKNCADKCGLQLSPWYVKALAFGSYGASGCDIKKSFEKRCVQKDGEGFINSRKELFYELTKQNYLTVGASCLAMLGIVCGLRYGNVMKWFKEFSKPSESGK